MPDNPDQTQWDKQIISLRDEIAKVESELSAALEGSAADIRSCLNTIAGVARRWVLLRNKAWKLDDNYRPFQTAMWRLCSYPLFLDVYRDILRASNGGHRSDVFELCERAYKRLLKVSDRRTPA